MSAVTVAYLDALLGLAMASARADDYVDALRKAPGLVVAAHLTRVAFGLLRLAARAATGRVRR